MAVMRRRDGLVVGVSRRGRGTNGEVYVLWTGHQASREVGTPWRGDFWRWLELMGLVVAGGG